MWLSGFDGQLSEDTMKIKDRATYDRRAVGMRLSTRRKQMGYSREYIANQVGIVEKYYADIERGTCGMSIETMIALADFYHFSLDEFIYGPEKQPKLEAEILEEQFESLSSQERQCCAELIGLFIRGIQKKHN